jgi:hypothetical protein
MKHLFTFLILAVTLGGNLTAQNSKSGVRFESVNGKETSFNQKKNLSTSPVDPQFFEKMKEKEKTILNPRGKVKQEKFQTKKTAASEIFRRMPRKLDHPSVTKSASNAGATITLKVIGDPWGDGTGFQALLDADAAIDINTITTSDEFYNLSEYSIPVGATADLTNPLVVLNDEVSITIPEGTNRHYPACIFC